VQQIAADCGIRVGTRTSFESFAPLRPEHEDYFVAPTGLFLVLSESGQNEEALMRLSPRRRLLRVRRATNGPHRVEVRLVEDLP
jgi:hypothetical protein